MEKMGQLHKIVYGDFGGTALKTEKHYYIFRSSATLKNGSRSLNLGKAFKVECTKVSLENMVNTTHKLHIKQ